MPEKTKKVGLVLGGGGSKGFAHLAIYKLLRDNSIPIDCISGCSIGAVIGAAIAIGKSPEEIFAGMSEFAKNGSSLIRWGHLNITQGSILDGQEEASFVEKLVPKTTNFADLKIPLVVNAVDLEGGKEIAISSGNVYEAIMASSAFPGLYPPFFSQNKLFVDGGIINSLPVNLIKQFNPGFTIAVDLKSYYTEQNVSALIYHFYMQEAEEKEDKLIIKKNFIKDAVSKFEFPLYLLLRSISIVSEENSKRILLANPPDVLIRPDLSEFSLIDTKDYQKIYDRGLEAGLKAIEEIKKKLSMKGDGTPWSI